MVVESTPDILIPFRQQVECVPAQSELVLTALEVRANGAFLAGLTERLSGRIRLYLSSGDQILASYEGDLTALAFDEWHGTAFYPELIAAFVTPNHPEVTKIVARAAGFLKQWTGDPSLDAYQRENPNRVRLQAAAVYAAMQEQNLVYAVPPASFEVIGQRVRLCDAVIQQKMGTCLDLVLFYAACLEAIGLYPLLVIQRGHIFAGLWLEHQMFSEAVLDDGALLTKRLADGIGEVAVVECTAMVSGRGVSFDRACAAAEEELHTPVEYLVDVHRARLSGIRPLPQRVQKPDGWHVVSEQRSEDEITRAPEEREEAVQVTEGAAHVTGKVAQWERKLLDLGLRNTLINLRMTQSVVPLLADSLGQLEDALASGEEYGIQPRPLEWVHREMERRNPEQYADLGACRTLLHSEFEQHRLRSALGPAELTRAITQLYRTARTSLEENGANTLYLALGLLRWYETKTSERPRYAPLVLLPMEIVRKSALKGYVIRLREEEPQMNITLLEMLRQDFGIGIHGLDPLPQDDHGVDLRKVYATMRRAVMDQPRWDIIETAFLGIFSFTQFVMWNDIRNRVEDLQQSELVRSLVEGKLAWQPESMDQDGPVDESGTLLPIPADASQLYAIQQAAKGQSFVLHGPPGTGKSQTITALIANALAQGKTVLFVAEKMAALSVVQTRLDRIGIGAFCLELHSNKSKKRDVLEQLKAAAEVGRGRSRESWAEKAEQTAALRRELDAYAKALHEPRTCGWSLFELVGQYEREKNAPVLPPLSAEFARTVTKEQLERQIQLAGRLVAAGREVGHPAGHLLRLVGRGEYSPALRTSLSRGLQAFLRNLDHLEAAGQAFSQEADWPLPKELAHWPELLSFAGTLAEWLTLPPAWTRSAEWDALLGKMDQLSQHRKRAQQLAQSLSERWKDSFLQQDATPLKSAWSQAALQWFLPRLLAQGRIVKYLTPYAKTAVAKDTLEQDLIYLEQYRREIQTSEGLEQELGPALEGLSKQEPDTLCALTEQARRIYGRLTAYTDSSTLTRFVGQNQLIPLANALGQAGADLEASWRELEPLLQPDENWLSTLALSEMREACQEVERGLEGLKDWCVWNAACASARENGMEVLVDAYQAGLAHGQVLSAWHRAVVVALISHLVEDDPVLCQFSGAVFREKIQQFQQLDAQLIELSKTEIFCRLAAKVPDFTQAAAQHSEVGILQRAIRSGGRGISIRKLFDQIPTLLPLLCPCMLMSPLSVAQYLDPKHPPFDLVVFDEASQLPTCKAVGALARGKNGIIVGDPKQMPPTSFFSSNTTDEENLEQEDLESILDDCLALNMPQSHLLWHYRSRHESLIAFSNREFYENRLYTFPSVNDRESMVRLVHVDGFFDRGKTRQNRAEAEAVVAELCRRAHDPSSSRSSVGVVTFNINQQNLISDLLDEACKGDPELEQWAYQSEEHLFIKNLENVQGDERDVILFSIGYGPDQQGHLSMNFGPLNREGGWRRLNVAVSRARQEMVVYATIRPEEINLARTSAQGVAALRDFLSYAATGTLQENVSSARSAGITSNGIVEDICAGLQEHGYQTHCMVGHSKYRLDIGVIHPTYPEQYLLGILLDGDSYRDARTTRDRELAQRAVLEHLGWNLHRIWTMDWLEQRKKELSRLVAHLKELEHSIPKRTVVIDSAITPVEATATLTGLVRDTAPAALEAAPASGPAPQPYKAAQLTTGSMSADEFLLPNCQHLIQHAIDQVLSQEGPICEALLIRRVVQSFGITRAGSRIQKQMQKLLSEQEISTTDQQGTLFYWPAGQTPETYQVFRTNDGADYRREDKELPVQEIANAAAEVLRQQIGLPEEDLVRETARLMGYTRIGGALRQAVLAGVSYGVKQSRFSEQKTGYYSK